MGRRCGQAMGRRCGGRRRAGVRDRLAAARKIFLPRVRSRVFTTGSEISDTKVENS